jgi:hypothetical protein
MRFLLCLLAALSSRSRIAERLTLDRIHADPALSGPGVRNLRVSPDGARVTFLRGRADNQFQLDLWEYNMKDKTTRRLVDSKKLVPNENLSPEEKARRERARTASLSGIISYSWSPDGKQLLVPIAGDLYLVDVARPEAARKVASGNVADPKISPKGRYVSFVRNQNLVVIDLATGAEKQLTSDGKGTIHNGEAEFVAQEEMGQHTGYYWAPGRFRDRLQALRRSPGAGCAPLRDLCRPHRSHRPALPRRGRPERAGRPDDRRPGHGRAKKVDLGEKPRHLPGARRLERDSKPCLPAPDARPEAPRPDRRRRRHPGAAHLLTETSRPGSASTTTCAS